MGARVPRGAGECTSQVLLVPPQMRLMIAAAGERHERRSGEQPADQRRHDRRPVAPRPARVARRETTASTAIAPSTSPITANPDAMSGTWSWSRTSTE